MVILLLICLESAISTLIAYNHQSSLKISNYRFFIFGNPAFYSVYGKAVFISNYPNSSAFFGVEGSFLVFFSYQNYTFGSLALLSQNAGAVGAVFVSQSSSWNFSSIYTEVNDYQMINIVLLGISLADGNDMKSLTGNVWLIYNYDIITTESPNIRLYISENYARDLVFLKAFQQLNRKFPLTKSNFTISVTVFYPSEFPFVKDNECLYNDYYKICMRSTSTTLGKDRVKSAIIILKFYNSVTNLTEFLNTLINLYNNCQFNFSPACTLSQLPTKMNFTETDFDTYYGGFSMGSEVSRYIINNIIFYWARYLESSFCLSFYNAPEACTLCSSSCSYSSLKNSYCDSSCNVSFCSYDNLNCITNKDCYNFLLGDGQCDSVCPHDPDCFCAPGCSYSEMSYGYCPMECSSSDCFSFCNPIIYCSPECDYTSLRSGVCPANCTDSCLDECNVDCSSHCNQQFSDYGYCPDDCTEICCRKKYKSSENKYGYILAYALPPIITFIVLIAIIVGYWIYRRRRSLNCQSLNDKPSQVISSINPPLPLSDNYDQKMNGNDQPNPSLLYNSHSDVKLYPVAYSQNLGYLGEALCAIDMTEFKLGESVVMTPCLHLFHPKCLKDLLDSGHERECPKCSFSLQEIAI